jgi:predicted alpha/beta hydrolase family esterase
MPRIKISITDDPWYPETHVLVKVYSNGRVYAIRHAGHINEGTALYSWKHYRNDFIPYNEATGCFIRA